MSRQSWVFDAQSWTLVPAGEYYRRKAAEFDRVRTGSPMIITDWGDAVRSPVDGTMLRSRADQREHNARNGVECIGNDKPSSRRDAAGSSLGKEIYDLLQGDRPLAHPNEVARTEIPE